MGVISPLSSLHFIQVVALVVARWLLGFWFSKHDIELLDDPIPDALYCKPCRDKHSKSKPLDLEGNPSIDTLASSTQCSSQDVVTSEPTSNPGNVCPRHRLDSFNITTEVDRCDLWRNMVKSLDTSPEVSRAPEDEVDGVGPLTTEGVRGYNERAWHPSDPNYHTLGTLEECENEMDSPSQESPSMPKFGSVPSPSYAGVTSPLRHGAVTQGVASPFLHRGVASPLAPSSEYHEHWHPSVPHEPWSSTTHVPYQSTAV